MTLELEERQDCVYGPSLSTCSNFLLVYYYRVQAFAWSPNRQYDVKNFTFAEQMN